VEIHEMDHELIFEAVDMLSEFHAQHNAEKIKN
jgi:hypothetical protein